MVMKHLSYVHDLGTSLVTLDKLEALRLTLTCPWLLSWLSRNNVCRTSMTVMPVFIEAITTLGVKAKSIFYGKRLENSNFAFLTVHMWTFNLGFNSFLLNASIFCLG